jgi:regulator of cell morphogenesis and NO signaling
VDFEEGWMNLMDGQTKDWGAAPLSALIDHILDKHHSYLREELPRLAQMAGKVVETHRERHGDSLIPLEGTLLELKNELESHMWKEEMVLFPLIRTLEAAEQAGAKPPPAHCGSVNNPIGVMEKEHEGAKRALDEMRRLTAEYALPEDACDTYGAFFSELRGFEADMHGHIHLEDDILFPRAAKLEASLQ